MNYKHNNTLHYKHNNALHYDTLQTRYKCVTKLYNTIQYNTTQYNTKQDNTIQYIEIVI